MAARDSMFRLLHQQRPRSCKHFNSPTPPNHVNSHDLNRRAVARPGVAANLFVELQFSSKGIQCKEKDSKEDQKGRQAR